MPLSRGIIALRARTADLAILAQVDQSLTKVRFLDLDQPVRCHVTEANNHLRRSTNRRAHTSVLAAVVRTRGRAVGCVTKFWRLRSGYELEAVAEDGLLEGA